MFVNSFLLSFHYIPKGLIAMATIKTLTAEIGLPSTACHHLNILTLDRRTRRLAPVQVLGAKRPEPKKSRP
jgi:hypothetical protein